MANQTQDVELRIRATNYSKQTTDKVVDALKEMTKAQDAQLESARKGTTTVAQLETSYQKLESAARALLSQQALTKLYEAQSQTLTELEVKLEAARKAQQDYSNSLTPGADRTKKEEAEIKRLGRALDSVEKQYMRAENRVETTAKRMAEFGITSANLAASQQKIVEAVSQANAALARQENAINTVDSQAAARKAQADAIMQREAQVKVDNLFAQAERDVAAALTAEAAAQRAASQAANDRNRERQVEVDVLFAQAQRQVTEELNKKNAALQAQQAALRAAADQAERLMRSSGSTARGSTPVVGPQLVNQIRDIQNPADAAMRSVDGIEAAVARLETRVSEIRGPVRDYRTAMDETRAAQQALLAVAGQVDAYQRQQTALRAAGAEYGRAQAAVRALVTEMRSGNAGDDVMTRLQRAQGVMQSAAQRLGTVRTEARSMQAALQAAGVDTNNLSNAEQALIAQAGRATTALNTLTQAYRQNGGAAEESGSRILNWFGGSGGRTTLSYAQRLRGELLGLAAGFIGLNAAIGLGKEVLDAYNQTTQIMNRLMVVNAGNAVAAAKDYAYLQAAADRIGVSFTKVAPAFAKFAIAANMAGMSTQQTRYIFEGFATATAKLGLSATESERVFKAIEQMFNKGKVSAEELTQQLGDVLPGALNQFAKAQGVSVDEFMKMMEKGEIAPSIMIKVAKQLQEAYGAVNGSTTNLAMAQARFENAANRFLNNTANGGFVQAYQQVLDKLTTMMNDGTADKFAQQISTAFVAVMNVLKFVADNFNGVTRAVEALIALKLAGWLFSLPALFRTVQAEVVLLRTEMVALNAWMARTEAAAALTAALGTGGVAGVVARLTPLVLNLARAFAFLGKASAVLAVGYAAYQATSALMDMADNGIRKRIVEASDAATKALQDAEAASKKFRDATEKDDKASLERSYRAAVDIADKKNRALMALTAEANAKGVNFNDAVASARSRQMTAATAGDNDGTQATAYPGDPDDSMTKLKALKKALADEDKKSDKAMRAARLKSAKEELDERLGIVDETFQKMREEAKTNIKDQEKYEEAIKAINASSAKAQAAERAKYNNEQAAKGKLEGERRVKLAMEIKDKLDSIEADIGKKNAKADPTAPYEERRAARVQAISHAYDELNGKILAEKKVNPQQAALDAQRLEVLKKQREVLEGENSDRDEANRLADEFNNKQTILKATLDEIKTRYDAGKLTSQQFLDETNYAVARLGPGVEAAGQAALDFAVKVKSVMDPVAYANLIASVRAGMAKTDTDATLAANNLAAQQTTLNQLLEQQQRDIDVITKKRSLGMISSEEEAAALNKTTGDYKTKIIENVDALLNLLQVARNFGAISEDAFNKAKASAAGLKMETMNAHAAASDLDKTIVNSIATNGVTAFEALATEIGKVAVGAESIGQGFRGALVAAGTFFAALLRDIAIAMVKQAILNAMVRAFGASSGIGGAAASMGGQAVAAAGHHTGGIVGRSATFTRNVGMAAFIGAPRYHTGGLAGFRPNEVPAILQKNEEVLTRDDPRHVLNGGKNAASGGGSNRFVLVDDRKNVAQAMATSEGEKVTLVHLRNNMSTLKQWFK